MSGGDWKAMFRGIQDGDLALVEFYLRSGIDPDYQHPEYLALPIAESIRFDRLAIAELLLEKGAKTHLVELETGLSPLELARKLDKQAFIDLLKKFA